MASVSRWEVHRLFPLELRIFYRHEKSTRTRVVSPSCCPHSRALKNGNEEAGTRTARGSHLKLCLPCLINTDREHIPISRHEPKAKSGSVGGSGTDKNSARNARS